MAGGRNGDAQLVLLDHGMYRELQPAFRREYSRLWVSLLTRDHESGRRAAAALGVRPDDYDALSLLLTFRSSTSARALGVELSAHERAALRQRYAGVTVADLNAFLERLPRDMLFVMRTCFAFWPFDGRMVATDGLCVHPSSGTWSLVRNLNRTLGGTSAQRFMIIAEHAVAGAAEPLAPDAPWGRRLAHQCGRRWARWQIRVLVRLINESAKLRAVLGAGVLRAWLAAVDLLGALHKSLMGPHGSAAAGDGAGGRADGATSTATAGTTLIGVLGPPRNVLRPDGTLGQQVEPRPPPRELG